MEDKIIVAVSGGPDSMYLLNKLLNEFGNESIVAAHVNYHFREESDFDQSVVVDFCKQNNIKLYIRDVRDQDWNDYVGINNKQDKSRKLRYDFFNTLGNEFDTNVLYVAHHKDDFIETAIMQKSRSDNYTYYGIKEVNYINGMEVKRPLLNMYKNQIIDSLNEKGIKFAIDKTNAKPIYERNQVRIDLSNKTLDEKEKLFNEFKDINEKNKQRNLEVEEQYMFFAMSNYDWNVFNDIKDEIKIYVIYKMLISHDKRINISTNKLNSVIEFLENKRGNKDFRLMENIYLSIKEGKIVIHTK